MFLSGRSAKLVFKSRERAAKPIGSFSHDVIGTLRGPLQLAIPADQRPYDSSAVCILAGPPDVCKPAGPPALCIIARPQMWVYLREYQPGITACHHIQSRKCLKAVLSNVAVTNTQVRHLVATLQATRRPIDGTAQAPAITVGGST